MSLGSEHFSSCRFDSDYIQCLDECYLEFLIDIKGYFQLYWYINLERKWLYNETQQSIPAVHSIIIKSLVFCANMALHTCLLYS